MEGTHPDTIKERTWYELCDNAVHIKVMIVEAPLTFGHSQLILTTQKDIEEDVKFGIASFVIKRCLPIIKECIPRAVEDGTWRELREYTDTKGVYIKTLILKASADESEKQYKVHLVPYFDSHFNSTKLLFHQDGTVDKNCNGGLLRWLGEREKRLDEEIEKRRDTNHFPTTLIKSFELIKLADVLRDAAKRIVR